MSSFDVQLDKIVARAEELQHELLEVSDSEVFARLSKELSELDPLVAKIRHLRSIQQKESQVKGILSDPELRYLAEAELTVLHAQAEEIQHAIRIDLLPKDEADERSAILEIRPAAGGAEAALFAAELFSAYQKFVDLSGWRFEVLSYSDTGLGGLKEAIASVTGKGVFARLKFESGVHRVQRVPATENQGRIHTSTVTVAVLPEAEEVDVDINETDLRIDVFRASGAGGQHINKTESAVRITHMPSGIVVSMQEEKSQHKNRAKAMKILRSRLYERGRAAAHAVRAADRKSQVGTGDRSERIRTYNFPQGRVTDHRINLTLYKIERIMQGQFGDIIDALAQTEQAALLADHGGV